MNVSPQEAEESLAAIQGITHKTRASIASSGAHISLIVTGLVWLIGFVCTQFLSGAIVSYIWVGLSVVGAAVASILGFRRSRHVRSPLAGPTARRMGLIWLLLAVCCGAAIAVARPVDVRQVTVFVVLFVMTGWNIMGMLLRFISVWPGMIIIALMLIGYFLLPSFFYLWMGILVGGGMIVLGLVIRSRW